MSILTKILLIIFITSIVLILLFITIAIYNKININNKIKWVSKESIIIIILLLSVISVFSSCSLMNSYIDDRIEEIEPNGMFDLQIKSSSAFEFGQGIIIYVKNNNIMDSRLEKLVEFNIHQDLGAIGRNNVDLKWDNNTAMLSINGETENLYIKIWLDNESNKFEYKSSYEKDNIL